MRKSKIYLIVISSMLLGIVISTTFSYAIAETLMNSKDVYYEDNSSLGFNNVQDAIDGTCVKFSEKIDNFLDKIYPVGSVYISTTLDTPAKVKTAIGGTWEVYGEGQTLVGIDTSSTEFKTLGQTGGAKSISYTPSGTIGSTGLNINQIPSHTHSYDKVDSETRSHTLTVAEMPIHSHTVTPSSDSSIVAGHIYDARASTTYGFKNGGSIFVGSTNNTGGGGGHTHPISTTSTSTEAAGKGTTSDGHTHTFTGTATTLNNLQPYITVYMYKRIS